MHSVYNPQKVESLCENVLSISCTRAAKADNVVTLDNLVAISLGRKIAFQPFLVWCQGVSGTIE